MNKQTSRPLRATTVEELRKEVERELNDIWSAINDITSALDNVKNGSQGVSDNTNTIRLVQDGDGYYIEGNFSNGWARLNTSLDPIAKK